MGDYPVLHLIVRYGATGAAIVSVVVLVLIAWAGFPLIGWVVIPVAIFAALLVYVIGKSYAELVKLITEMLLPH